MLRLPCIGVDQDDRASIPLVSSHYLSEGINFVFNEFSG